MEENLGRVISGWRIIRTIGKGSFGTVYEIEKEDEFGALMHSALKVISIPETDAEIKDYRGDGYDDASITALFKSRVEDVTAEFKLMNKLKGHTNIVSFEDYSIVQHDNVPGYDVLIRMELLTSLPDYINRQFPDGEIPDKVAIELGIDICRALELCSKNHIIHRDIKPMNIFVNENRDFKLGDFGVAKTSDHTTKATKTGAYGYMAPEVYLSKPYNASVDIYSLGLAMYWMLNERRGPFMPLPPAVPKPSQNAEAMDRRMSGEPLPAPKHGSEELKRIVLKACAFDPKDRYATPLEMRRDLERAYVLKEEEETITSPIRPVAAIPAEADEQTVGVFQKESEKERTIFAATEPNPTEQTTEKATILSCDAEEKTVGIFPWKDETPVAPHENTTVGLFAKETETVRAPVNKEPEPILAPKAKIEKPAEKPKLEAKAEKSTAKPQSALRPANTQANRKAAGKKQKKKHLLIIAAVTTLAVIATAVLIVVLAGKGTSAQQAEALIKMPIEAPTPNPVVVFQNEDFEKAFRDKYRLTGTIYESDILACKTLSFISCGLTDISDLARFRNLTYLNLRNNQLSDISALSGLTKLTKLNLPQNKISDISSLSGLTDLTYLNLSFNQINDISALSGMTDLTELYLDHNIISDASALSGMTDLTELSLRDNQISDLSALSGLTKLTKLYLYENKISDVSALSELTKLTELSLGNNNLSQKQLNALKKELPNCKIDN
jgi:serine/threonine protein kinase